MSSIIRQTGPIEDGQHVLETAVIRRVKLSKPDIVTVASPKQIASAVAGLFGSSLQIATREEYYHNKLLRIEATPLRWMKPGPNGTIVPR